MVMKKRSRLSSDGQIYTSTDFSQLLTPTCVKEVAYYDKVMWNC